MAKFTFMLYSFSKLETVPGTSSTFKIPTIEVEAATFEKAVALAEPQIPETFRIFCWSSPDWELDDQS